MSGPYVRYAEPPQFVLNYPTCSACVVDLDHDCDGWQCPKCGTSWASDASDADEGELYAAWSGESVDHIPVSTHDDGYKVAWIDHPYEEWIAPSGLDMGRCYRCYAVKSMHVKATS